MGASTLGVASPSQYMRRTSFFRWKSSGLAMVTQTCVMTPGPASSSNVSLAGDNLAIVLIASRAVVAGRALLHVILGFGQARKQVARSPRILSQRRRGYSENG